MTNSRRIFLALMLAGATALPISVTTINSANAATAEDLNKDADQALQSAVPDQPRRGEDFAIRRARFSYSRRSSRPALCSAAAMAKAFSRKARKLSITTTRFPAPGACRRARNPMAMWCS